MASKFPEEIDKLKRVQNFPQSQAGNVKRYNELRTKSNLTSAEQSELQNLTQTLSPYMKTVDDMNLEVDAIENVQKFFKQEVDGYVNAKQSEMQSYADTKKNEVEAEISKFSYKGNYRSDLTYQQRNYVTYNDGTGNNTFIAVKNVPAGIDPSNIEYWHKLGIKGEKGNDGIGLVFKGAWNNTDLYEVGSAVQYGGIIFGCLKNNTGQQPDLTKDTEYWAKAWSATVITTKLIGTRTINAQTKSVNFMTGEITAFNPATDILEVYCNTVALTKGKDYMIGSDNQSIIKIDNEWDGTEIPIFFEFRVTRNQLNDLVFSDGQSIANGTISKNKLTQDIQDNLNNSEIHINNTNNPHNVTIKQIGAVSQQDLATHKAEQATTIKQGHVQLSTSTTSTSTTTAATSSAVKAAMDRANDAFQSASDGKVKIGRAITGVDDSVVIPTDPTFEDLAGAISTIKTGYLSGLRAGDGVMFSTRNIANRPSTEYVEIKSFLINGSGTIRVRFSLQGLTGYSVCVFGRVYINGEPAGIERSTTVSAYEVWYTQDFTVNEGDKISIYTKASHSGFSGNVQEIQLCIDTSELYTEV